MRAEELRQIADSYYEEQDEKVRQTLSLVYRYLEDAAKNGEYKFSIERSMVNKEQYKVLIKDGFRIESSATTKPGQDDIIPIYVIKWSKH